MSNWFLLLFAGILAMILGGVAVVNPQAVSIGVELFLAVSFIVMGVVTCFLAFSSTRGANVFWTLILGVLMVLAGVFLWNNQDVGIFTIALIFGIISIAMGAVMFMAMFDRDLGGYRWGMLLGAIANFVIAYFLFTQPAVSIGLLLGVQLIVDGFSLVIFSFGAKQVSSLFVE